VLLGGAFDVILAAAQTNAGWAFSRLYEWLAPAVSGYVRLQGVRDDEDVVNEVFLAAFTRLGTFQGDEAQFRSWVFTIAHHRIVDARRAHARTPPMEDIFEAESWGRELGCAPSAEDVALPTLEVGRLRGVLDRLSPDQRDVLMMRVVADLSVEQVADALGKQPGAVRALQHRAVLAVRRHIAAEAVTR
jgi:RNA polymerase sigma-70 factor (ECF subfamily)